jgi:uncharacterized SAM-binding protein YcdF (DUF218 family)
MFFPLSKILGFFAIPSNLIIVVGLCGVLLLRTRFTRTGWVLTIGSLLLLAVVGFSPVGNALIVPLEERFPAWDSSRGAPDGVIVLGGAVTPDVSAARKEPALNEAAERMTAAVELARRYPAARIIFSGGDSGFGYGGGNESEAALLLFERLGVAKGRILTEDQSRNTVENALFSMRIAAPKPGERWLLVTSAYHMPRSIGVFRQVGFPVEAYPVDWRTRGPQDASRPFATVGDGLRRTDTAVREWVGLVAYRLTGKSSELLPGPTSAGGCDLSGASDNCRP